MRPSVLLRCIYAFACIGHRVPCFGPLRCRRGAKSFFSFFAQLGFSRFFQHLPYATACYLRFGLPFTWLSEPEASALQGMYRFASATHVFVRNIIKRVSLTSQHERSPQGPYQLDSSCQRYQSICSPCTRHFQF